MRALFAIAFGSVWLNTAPAQTVDFTRLDRYLTEVAANIPTGFEVAIVQNGRELFWKPYGPWTKDKQASIASATKWFSGAVIMSLVDDGTLSLDDRASKYLPYMTGEKESITIRQLMSHTAGFPGEFPVADPCLNDSADTLAHCAEALANLPLKEPPGTAFIYAGAGMQVAGRVAEVASGKDWQTLFRERIAIPLGMTATDYEYQGPTRNPRISGGGRSTVSDYMKFLTMIRQRGMYEGRRVLSTRAIDAMLADQTRGVPIVESPFASTAPDNRYGIGNWVEVPGSTPATTQNSSIGLAGWTPLFDAGRDLQLVIGMQNALRPFQPYYFDMKRIVQELIPLAALTPVSITNAASYEAGPIAPFEMLALFGGNLGPSQPVTGNATALAGTQVTFDGAPGSILYTSARQVTVVAPPAIAGKSTVQVQVTYNDRSSPAISVPVSTAWPGLFSLDASGRGPGVILNAGGSLNNVSSPASRGSSVQLFGTGACLTNGDPADTAVSVTIGGHPAPVSSCGPANGLPQGVFQATITVPAELQPANATPVAIQSGGYASLPAITIAVK